MKTKTNRLLLIASLSLIPLLGACRKHPDDPPAQRVQAPPPPPPVNHCQGATVPVQLPIYDQVTGTNYTSTVTGFDLGCGDTVSVLIRNIQLAPTDPWTTILSDPSGSTWYDLNGQQVTLHNNTGNTVHVSISAVLY